MRYDNPKFIPSFCEHNSRAYPPTLKPLEIPVPKKPKSKRMLPVVDKDGYEELECNKRLINTIAEDMEITISAVESIVAHYNKFVDLTIRSGTLEGVSVPYLGKFIVKPEDQQYKAHLNCLTMEMRRLFQSGPPKDLNQLL